MMKWFIGISSAIILGAMGWCTTFILMGYQAKADIEDLKTFSTQLRTENSEIKSEVRAIKEITKRTENNTEQIRSYLLGRAIPLTDSRK